MNKDPKIFLQHILDSIDQINFNLNNISEENFSRDIKIQDATVRRLEIIGEAVKNLPKSFTSKYKNIPWKEIAGMRDKLIHNYLGVDMSTVWETCQQDLPTLEKQIKQILTN